MQLMKPKEAPCGKTYDDAECSTICPHEPLPPKLTYEEYIALNNKHVMEDRLPTDANSCAKHPSECCDCAPVEPPPDTSWVEFENIGVIG